MDGRPALWWAPGPVPNCFMPIVDAQAHLWAAACARAGVAVTR